MQYSRTEKPTWAFAQREADITDVWLEQVDPENETGVSVTAFLSADSDGDLQLNGVAVEDIGVTLFYGREYLREQLGMDAIWRIESNEMEVASDEFHCIAAE